MGDRPDLRLVGRPNIDPNTQHATRYKFARRVKADPALAARLDDAQLDNAIKWTEAQRSTPGTYGTQQTLEIAHQNLMAEWLKRGPSLRQAHADTMRDAGTGTTCPCCQRHVKRYSHCLSGGRARALCWLVGASNAGRDWVHVPTKGPRWMVKTNQHPVLAWWGLVERRANDDPNNGLKHQGNWRPTALGVAFARDEIAVPRKVSTYNGRVLEVSDELVDIRTALGSKFDYDEEMKHDGPVPVDRSILEGT